MLGLVTRTEPAARRPIVLQSVRGCYVATGESARRLSLVTGRPLVRVHRGASRVFTAIAGDALADTVRELKTSGYTVAVAPSADRAA